MKNHLFPAGLYYFKIICGFLLFGLFSGCAAELIAAEAGVGAADLSAAEAIGATEEAGLLRSGFGTSASGEGTVINPGAVNELLGKVRLEKVYGESPKLFIEGKSQPFAEVYANSNRIRMLGSSRFYTIPDNILAVSEGTVQVTEGALGTGRIVASVKQGELLVKLAEQDGWYQIKLVRYGRVYYGWINAAYVGPLIFAGGTGKRQTTYARMVMYEQFTDNYRGWFTANTQNCSAAVINHHYEIDNHTPRFFYIALRAPNLNINYDYLMNAKLTHVSGDSNKGFGLHFADNDRKNYYDFEITASGFYSVNRCVNGRRFQLLRWTVSDAIKKGDGQTNFLGLRKTGHTIAFYINSNIVSSIDNFDDSDGLTNGFTIDNGQRVNAEFLKIVEFVPAADVQKAN